MITFVSFILILLGALNWLSIGALQYDFVAGLFGSQASMFSRIVYFFIGVAAIWIVVQAFRGKGRIKINDDGFEKKKKDVLAEEVTHANNSGNNQTQKSSFQNSNSEAGLDMSNTNYYNSNNNQRNFPRDMSRYQNYENINQNNNFSMNENYTNNNYQNQNHEYMSHNNNSNNHVDYRSLGYKDFNEEDLDN